MSPLPLGILAGSAASGPPSLNDFSFNKSNVSSGFNNTVRTFAVQSDGKIVVGGFFTSHDGTTTNRIVRLNADGSRDNSFAIGSAFNEAVYSVAIQADGKIVVGGFFTSYNGTPINRIARLNADGTLDTSFVVGSGFGSTVFTLAIQPDGKIIAAGVFRSYNGTSLNRIARLNADGSLDTSWVLGSGVNSYQAAVWSLNILPDGKIILGGKFGSYSGTQHGLNRIRINADGTLDLSFVKGVTFPVTTNIVYSVAIQSDGKIILGGLFTSYNNTVANRIVRLNADGTHDASFVSGSGFDSTVFSLAIQPDDKILVGGGFTSYNGTTTNFIAKLNAAGTLDTSFEIGSGFNSTVDILVIQPDGKILVGGVFTTFNGITRTRIARLHPVPS